jgi:transcriptional regulator with XRE-family HTH domain
MTPNGPLQVARMSRRWSREDVARKLQDNGMPGASVRTVLRLENGHTRSPNTRTIGALERVFGEPIELLGFDPPQLRVASDDHGGHNLGYSAAMLAPAPAPVGRPAARGNLTGVWVSRYEYYSSSRDGTFANSHHVLVVQTGDAVTVRSLHGSVLTMNLTADAEMLTGTWREVTNPDGYYRGATYHGAIQMIVGPTGRRMEGKWLGFGKEGEINTGPWRLDFQTSATDQKTLRGYDRAPTEEN